MKCVEELYAVMGSRDWSVLPGLLDEAVVWRQNPGFPGGGVHIGILAVIEKVFQGNAERWASFGFRRDAIWDTGEQVVVTGAYLALAKHGVRSIEADACHVFTFQADRVSSFQQYTDTQTLWDALGS